ncbi:MAG: hypothetical protein Fur0041_15320 [Bacteroidia bacterium]
MEDLKSLPADIAILLKIGQYFINQRNIAAISRFGKGTKIVTVSGEEFVVNIGYDKVSELISNIK